MTSYSSYNAIKIDRESDNPIDTIQSILWDPYDKTATSFFTCGWDGYIRYYQIEGNSSKMLARKWDYYFQHPVITMDVTSSRHILAGLSTGHVCVVDQYNTNNACILGVHQAPICKVVWVQKYQVLLTLGFDNLLKVFSLKQSNNNFQIAEYILPAKTNTASFSYPFLLIGSQDGKIALLNIQNLQNINFKNQYQYIFDESHGIIKFTASTISSNKRRIILGTADGRIISTSFQQNSSNIRISKPTVVKYQKREQYRKAIYGQMNCLDYGMRDSKTEFVLFCGTNESGIFNLQKGAKTKTLSSDSSPSYTAIALSPDCEYYAYAVGNDWCKGMEEITITPKIYVNRLSTSDFQSYGR